MLHKRYILQGSASNLARAALAMMVALVLPPLLVHRLTPAEYGAWLLILQCSTYINLLDLGLQTAISKFVAEYAAIPDRTACSRIISSSFAILCVSGLFGALGIALVTWRVPELFHQMPVSLVPALRDGILAVGLSTAIALPFNAFIAVFTGLQRYGFPTVLALATKTLCSAALAALLLMHGKLVQLAIVMGIFNLLGAAGQFVGWKKYAKAAVGFSLRLVSRDSVLALAKYGSVLSIWTVATLFISGLDMVIVGHYDYKNTGYYGLATSVTNFMLLLIGSLFGPLLPAVSSVQAGRTPSQIGDIVVTTTRYCALLICLIGLPLLLFAYPVLKLWVGDSYAMHTVLFLEILILGNAIRQLGYPYALVVVATGKQHLATMSGVIEAAVNVCVSIYLVERIGAVGVALGTLVGAFVSVGVHLTVSMMLTRSTILLSRRVLLLQGLMRPLACVIPSLLLLPFWRRSSMLPANPSAIALWALTTLGIAWFVGLTWSERLQLRNTAFRLIHWDQVRT
jgi:O-antigen/teichoic acid export membrane protein